MVDIFKNWISTILTIGILFTILKMILPETNLKKYIYSLIGIVTIIVVLSPVLTFIKFNVYDIEDIILNATSSISTNSINYTDISNYEEINKNNLKENFKATVEEDIRNKIRNKISNDVDVNIKITESYNIDKINLILYGDTSFDIQTYICKEYDINRENVSIQRGG